MMVSASWGRSPARVDAAFIASATAWLTGSEDVMLERVWLGFDVLEAARPPFDPEDLERSITERLESSIQECMSGDEPFTVQHNPYERETKRPAPAQPPQYDIAFVFRADPRVMWPLEAKVLETPRQLANYVDDVNEQFLTCRYAPFSPSGAMVGYLLSGAASTVFSGLAKRLACELGYPVRFTDRSGAVSAHARTVPAGKPYPPQFRCHHIILTLHGVARAKAIQPRASHSI